VISATNTEINAAASAQGVLFLGSASLEYPQAYARFRQWIDANRHGEMAYLENHDHLRRDPQQLHPGAQSALVFALPYFRSELGEKPRVALYAHYPDYHKVLREKLEAIAAAFLPAGSFRVLVDSAPVLERALAAQTAQGFIGKNTLYIHPAQGSFLLLGEILAEGQRAVDVPPEIPLDRKTKQGGCGPCDLCQVACPTGALNQDYTLEAKRCLSYWTIEQRGPIPEEYWPWLKEYYFGCDLCQLACPYNKRAAPAPVDWKARTYPDLFTTATMDQKQYEASFGGTPLTRAKRQGLRRNALVAMAVTGHPRLTEALAHVELDGGAPLEETREQILKFRPGL